MQFFSTRPCLNSLLTFSQGVTQLLRSVKLESRFCFKWAPSHSEARRCYVTLKVIESHVVTKFIYTTAIIWISYCKHNKVKPIYLYVVSVRDGHLPSGSLNFWRCCHLTEHMVIDKLVSRSPADHWELVDKRINEVHHWPEIKEVVMVISVIGKSHVT